MLTKLSKFFALLFLASIMTGLQAATSPQNSAILLSVNGAIGPATQDYIHRGISKAAEHQVQIIILQLDTPGGLDKSTRSIVQDMLAAPLPIVVYVAPSGARAASAGTYMVFASHIAAMSPGTNLGSATPIQIGGISSPTTTNPSKDALTVKVINDSVAFIRSLAELRGRNVQWAEETVRKGVSISATEALRIKVIDIIAKDVPDLLQQLNGRQINLQGHEKILATTNLTVIPITPDWRSKVLAVITEPNIAYILLLIGIYGLFFEFANPGFVVPGIAGAIALLLALYAFQLLPINYAGLALILLGIIFLVAEMFMPSFGALGIGGVIAFIVGSMLLLDESTGYSLDWSLVITMAVINALFILSVLGMAFKARRRKIVTGRDELLGMTAEVIDDADKIWVRVHGEIWQARSLKPVKKGQQVRILNVDGLTLVVEPIDTP